jgi:hypothetical protein
VVNLLVSIYFVISVFFIVSLLLEVVSNKTYLDVEKDDDENRVVYHVHYEKRTRFQSNLFLERLGAEAYNGSILEIKVIRVENIKRAFGTGIPSVKITLGSLELRTNQALSFTSDSDGIHSRAIWSSEILKFPLNRVEGDNFFVSVEDDDGYEFGKTEISTENLRNWVANGRFEGKIYLDSGGTVQVVVKVGSNQYVKDAMTKPFPDDFKDIANTSVHRDPLFSQFSAHFSPVKSQTTHRNHVPHYFKASKRLDTVSHIT